VLIFNLVLTAALATTAAPFSAQPLEGEAVTGEISAINAKELILKTDAGPVTLGLDTLAVLTRQPAEKAAAPGAGYWIELADGSGLPATEYAVKDGIAKVVGASGRTQDIPARKIRSVRFAAAEPLEPKLAKQWAEITVSKAAGDLLVVRKNDAFDYLEGVIKDLDGESCQFELEGEVIPVKRAKIAGLVYALSVGGESPEPLGKLLTTDGAKLQLRSLELAGEQLKIETPGGTAFELPLAEVVRFDFSSGKIAYLSDLEPENAAFTPLIGFAQPPQGLLGYFDYRRDVGFDQNPLKLDGKEFRKGLSLASRTELVYKLPGKFRVFRASAGIDDTTRETGSVRLEIKGDGKVLWEGDVRGDEPAQQLELEIGGVKRLAIVADYGAGLDVGDRLDLGDAQISK
jgi:hypothetical protein